MDELNLYSSLIDRKEQAKQSLAAILPDIRRIAEGGATFDERDRIIIRKMALFVKGLLVEEGYGGKDG